MIKKISLMTGLVTLLFSPLLSKSKNLTTLKAQETATLSFVDLNLSLNFASIAGGTINIFEAKGTISGLQLETLKEFDYLYLRPEIWGFGSSLNNSPLEFNLGPNSTTTYYNYDLSHIMLRTTGFTAVDGAFHSSNLVTNPFKSMGTMSSVYIYLAISYNSTNPPSNWSNVFRNSYFTNNIDELLEDYYTAGFDNGFIQGENKGYKEGYNDGLEDGMLSTEEGGVWNSLFAAVLAPFSLLEIEIFPGVTLGMIALIPIVFGLIAFIFKLGGKGGG